MNKDNNKTSYCEFPPCPVVGPAFLAIMRFSLKKARLVFFFF